MKPSFAQGSVFMALFIILGHSFTPHDHTPETQELHVTSSCNRAGFLHILAEHMLAETLTIDIGGEHLEDFQPEKNHQLFTPDFCKSCHPLMAELNIGESLTHASPHPNGSPPCYAVYISTVRLLRAPPRA